MHKKQTNKTQRKMEANILSSSVQKHLFRKATRISDYSGSASNVLILLCVTTICR